MGQHGSGPETLVGRDHQQPTSHGRQQTVPLVLPAPQPFPFPPSAPPAGRQHRETPTPPSRIRPAPASAPPRCDAAVPPPVVRILDTAKPRWSGPQVVTQAPYRGAALARALDVPQ